VPKLWTETIDAHRRAVRDATLDTTAALVAEHGLPAVTMSEIAERTGIGRATLYKYFPDVEAILIAWHERQIGRHLDQLAKVRDQASNPHERLPAVLEAYALIRNTHPGGDLAPLLHRGEHMARVHRKLHDLIRDLVADAAASGDVRDDVPTDELATYCIHALTAATDLPTKAAVHRLVTLTIAGLRTPH
jgi:AcrR family transcriptional regulator